MKKKETNNVNIHESVYVDSPCEIGEGTSIWHYSHILPHSKIGVGCIIGQNVMVGSNVVIGNNCKIQNNVSIYDGVIIEDDVFCGPSMVFTNVINPRAFIERKSEFKPTIVKKGATIGANATIVCGVKLGRYCFIAAGAVVVDDVKDYSLIAGIPAKAIGWVCQCGNKLNIQEKDIAEINCEFCDSKYILKNNKLSET